LKPILLGGIRKKKERRHQIPGMVDSSLPYSTTEGSKLEKEFVLSFSLSFNFFLFDSYGDGVEANLLVLSDIAFRSWPNKYETKKKRKLFQ